MLILICSCLAALIVPGMVVDIFDMFPWNFPRFVAVYFGAYSLVIYPFSVLGGWGLMRVIHHLGSRNRT